MFTIGRASTCDVVLADDSVAAEHARIEAAGESGLLILSDCGQAPATQIVHRGEARPIRRAMLAWDDSVRFGEVEMSVPELIEAVSFVAPIESWLPPDHPARRGVQAAPVAAPPSPIPTPAPAPPSASPASSPAADAMRLLPCGKCGQMTDSLKRHRVHKWIVFVGIAWWAQMADYTACPSCMRAILVERTLVNLPGANLAWPVILVVNSVRFARSFSKGHSGRVRKELLL